MSLPVPRSRPPGWDSRHGRCVERWESHYEPAGQEGLPGKLGELVDQAPVSGWGLPDTSDPVQGIPTEASESPVAEVRCVWERGTTHSSGEEGHGPTGHACRIHHDKGTQPRP